MHPPDFEDGYNTAVMDIAEVLEKAGIDLSLDGDELTLRWYGSTVAQGVDQTLAQATRSTSPQGAPVPDVRT